VWLAAALLICGLDGRHLMAALAWNSGEPLGTRRPGVPSVA